MVAKKYVLDFTPDIVDKAVTYKLASEYGLLLNILRAEVNENGGQLILVIDGPAEKISKGIKLLEDSHVKVKELKEYVSKSDSRCTDCGMCVSICPVSAFELDTVTFAVRHVRERCIACGLCLDACPPGALSLRA